jgi:hypothetical protein
MLAGVFVASCGGSSKSNPAGEAGTGGGDKGGGSGGEAATVATGGSAGAAHGGNGGGAVGHAGSGGASAGTGATANAGKGGSGIGGAGSGGRGETGGVAGSAGTGGSHAGGASSGASGNGAGGASGGTSGSAGVGEAGSGGERAVECTGALQYFPDFERSCATDTDCVVVVHQTNCCGSESAFGIRESELAAFNAAEATCDQQYPACGCASFGVDVEDGTRVDFASKNEINVSCDAGTCKAHYAGMSFACGTLRCTEGQYCVQSSGGPSGTPTSFACNPSACTDCSCLTMPDCTCSDSGGLTFICQHA